MRFRAHVAEKPAEVRILRLEVASPRHLRGRVVRTAHPYVRLRQIVVQRGLLRMAGDCLLEKWYAFCESPLFEDCNTEVGRRSDIGRIGLHRLAELCLRLFATSALRTISNTEG